MTLDISCVTERLWVGANITKVSEVGELVGLGITHVIDANTDDETPLFQGVHHITLLSNPTPDDGQHKGVEWFAPAIDFAIDAMGKPGKVLLTHCHAGINRGPSLGYAVMRTLGWSNAAALDWIHRARPVTTGGIRYWPDADQALSLLGWIA